MNQDSMMPEQGQRANAMKEHMLLGALLAAFGAVGAAYADDDCHASMDRWQPREAVQDAARERGWQIDRIKIDDGCYEIKGTDAQGAAFKAKLDPATLEVVKMKRKDRDDDDDDDRDDDRRGRERGQNAPLNPPTNLPPPGGLLGGGGPPAVVVK